MAFRSAKKNLFCTERPPLSRQTQHFPNEAGGLSPSATAAQPTSKKSHSCAKRERCHAPSASHRDNRHATPSPLIALRHLRNTHGAQRVHACRLMRTQRALEPRGGRRDEESGDQLAPVHLQRLQIIFQWDCCCSCQARAQRRRTSSCMVKINLPSRRAVCLAAVLPHQFGTAHATMLACVSQCAAVCDPYVVLPCS